MKFLYSARAYSVAAAILSLAVSAAQGATTYGNVTYTATGMFDTTVISGLDNFRLAGEPFTITLVANDTQLSKFHGPTYADYGPLPMTGTIYTRLMPTPIAIQNRSTFMLMAYGNPSYDLFMLGSQLRILSLNLNIKANIVMPKGTLTTVRNHPFGPVTLSPDMATMTYTDGTSSTTVGIIGTLTATAPSAARSRMQGLVRPVNGAPDGWPAAVRRRYPV
jgi:hypothetical protein